MYKRKPKRYGVLPARIGCRLLLCGLCLIIIGRIEILTPAAAETYSTEPKSPEQMEYEVKAAFIYNFMKFIQWPGDKEIKTGKNDTPEPITIAILGNNPFNAAFQYMLDKNIQGRPIRLMPIESFENFRSSYPSMQSALAAYKQTYLSRLRQCHLLFICDSERNALPELLEMTTGHVLVTVSDAADFAAEKGMIGFVKENNKVRFEVNLDAAQAENIKISSQLLGLAKRVYKKEGKNA
jgi:hypothetical protein